MPTTLVQSYHLHSWGSKGDPPVLLLHGFTGHGGSWAETGQRFAAAGYNVLAPDLLGHGRSAHPSDATRYGMAHAAADLNSLLDESSIEAVHLLGYSMGGRLGLFFALSRPERVRTLSLVSASPGIASTAERDERRDRDDALADQIERDGIAAFVDHWESLPMWASQRRYLSSEQHHQLRLQRLRNLPDGLANSLRGMGTGNQPALHEKLPTLSMPTLLIAGAEDEKFAGINRQMERRIPQARLVILPMAGHAVQLERPRAFERTVLEFWQSYEVSRPKASKT
ncbi:MAG: 2-succinyl-6-hydroxy-2,4-cyclohexadiene-1-carboxylate synthase [Caldilineaceae bacterium SB0668_bin_21]|nr:2-succinyl-6-hydroxy-2,4-cyclohexadiene-1-carboxylate synthase [Caldilineaceae bacterium SB0668_bin_21]MYC24172.1 2-succinyl-6-hydroxy-2,4-cyclohexadiene-1-carboxylate synthase [Caldilineaceae bacterium SB0662_bin_25]